MTTQHTAPFTAQEMATAFAEIADDVREFWLGAWTFGDVDYVVEPANTPTRRSDGLVEA